MSIEVHVDCKSGPVLAGRLHSAIRGPSVSFEYDQTWLEREDAFAIDPTALPLQRGAHYKTALFGAFQDCGPDRWGRLLIERAARKNLLALKPHREIDFALAIDDFARIGALRFREGPRGPFLAASIGKIPPLVRLSALLDATNAVHHDSETAQDLRFLLGAGSPLGGARPKSAVVLPDGQLAIAKFPKPDDTRDIAAGEILGLRLAAEAGMHVATHRLVRISRHSVAVVTRFDRSGASRIPFVSASTLLGLGRDSPGAYVALADAIRRHGDDVISDLRELWRRLIFSLLASNFDDHPRNLGFLMAQPGRWRLSPAYDINPMPEMDRFRCNKMPIFEGEATSTVEGALAAAEHFGLEPSEATAILRAVFSVTLNWRKGALQMRLPASTLKSYQSAFENPLMEEAKRLLASNRSRRGRSHP